MAQQKLAKNSCGHNVTNGYPLMNPSALPHKIINYDHNLCLSYQDSINQALLLSFRLY